MTTPAPYQPCPRYHSPITRCTLRNRRGYVIDSWREEGELYQVWKDKSNRLWLGLADAEYWQPAYYPIVTIDHIETGGTTK